MFKLSVITPLGKVFEDTVTSLAAPGLTGGFEVYSNHMPMICALKTGAIRIRKSALAKEQAIKIDSGILEVNADHDVLLLADQIMG